jgi:RND superfamily putative drug exporter
MSVAASPLYAASSSTPVMSSVNVVENDRVLRMFGLGMAVAVLLDTTLIGMLLVPATMELLGARNWWMPRWLDRLVPRLNAERTSTAAGADSDGHDHAPSSDKPRMGPLVPAPHGAAPRLGPCETRR